MNIQSQSIISKIVEKGVVTPFEAMYVQYLSRQYILKQMPDIDYWGNPYLAADNVPEVIKDYQLKTLLSFQTLADGQLYDSYQWSANHLRSLDDGCVELGYKGIAILNELRYMRDESVIDCLMSKYRENNSTRTLFDQVNYSLVFQKSMSFKELIEEFVLVFRFMIISIDNIFSLNWYLNGLIPIDELKCIQYIHNWLVPKKVYLDESEQDSSGMFNIARLCFPNYKDIVIQNHGQFCYFLKREFASKSIYLPKHFEESSRGYVLSELEEEGKKNNLETLSNKGK